MDRLHTVNKRVIGPALLICLAWVLGACEDHSPTRAPHRVNAVSAKPPAEAAPPDDFCDAYYPGDQAPAFSWPQLAKSSPPPHGAAGEGWLWVNVWASWCVPCAEEMPLLARWQKNLGNRGLSDLVLLSVDDTPEKVADFRTTHPATPESLLIASPAAAKPWFVDMGADAEAPLPVHLFVDSADRVRCVRAGGISDDDRGAIARVISE